MKKIVFILCAVFTLTTLTSCMWDHENDTDYSVAENSLTVVTFLHSPTCGYSCAAKEYVTQTYPNAAIRFIDIDLAGNRYFLKAAKQDYGLDSYINTPVICFGPLYIEGWDYEKRQRLDDYIQPYLKTE
ncbi:MAG: hypothetical protein IJ770_00910 [Alphaproteobacteria bacterium]|nr:hypothetical protein [Alphaproteobacteria bacterium]